jgi:hypothetical protein
MWPALPSLPRRDPMAGVIYAYAAHTVPAGAGWRPRALAGYHPGSPARAAGAMLSQLAAHVRCTSSPPATKESLWSPAAALATRTCRRDAAIRRHLPCQVSFVFPFKLLALALCDKNGL